MEDEDQNIIFTRLLNKRQKLIELRNIMIQSRSSQDKADEKYDFVAGNENRGLYEETIAGPSYCDTKTGFGVDGHMFEVECLDPSREFSDYDSDDSVKDKTYEPHKDLSDASHVSDSPVKVFAIPRSMKVKRKLSFSEESPQKYAKVANHNVSLITLDDLLGPQNRYRSETPVLNEKSQEPDPSFVPTSLQLPPVVYSSVDTFNESLLFEIQSSPTFEHSNNTNRIIVQEQTSSSQNKNDHPENKNLIDSDDTTRLSTIPRFDDTSSHDDNILNSYEVMIADTNGNIYLPVDRQIKNNADVQLIDTAIPSKSNSKKKIKNVTKWKRVATKIARLKGSPYHSSVAKKKPEIDGRELKPPCTCKFKCYEKVPHEARMQIFNEFWKKITSWDQRRQFIVCNVTKKLKRMMKTDGDLNTDRRKFSYEYRLIINSKSEKICRIMFLNTLSIGEKFVKVSLEKQLDGGLVAPDLRGKHVPGNKTSDEVVQSVIDHINLYPCYESHYSRQKSGRKFLGPDLNIPTMYRQYKEMMDAKETPTNLIAKEWLYRNIFNTKFNLSFKLPSVDTCDDCDAFERKLLDELDDKLKQKIEKEKKVHADAAQERYSLKKNDKKDAEESSGTKKVLMFDLQKCLATPNLTNSKSFYLRKLWTLNLTIFDSTANTAANILWSENIGGRGGNEIASCLIRWFEENSAKLINVREITLWSDNCAGQNRNLMIVMAYMWILHKHPQLKVINHKFMLKGHTHMEVDQIHSQIEKKKKQLKTMQIATPRDWSQFIRTCGGKRTFDVYDMQLHNFKDITSLYRKNGPFVSRKKNKDAKDFKISECVWLQVKQEQPGVLFFKNTFAEDFSEISFIRNASKRIQFPEHLPSVRQTENTISTAKYNDLISLLQWIPKECHTYYKNLKHSSRRRIFLKVIKRNGQT